MLLHLVKKEVREHAAALGALVLLELLQLAIAALAAESMRSATLLTLLRVVLQLFVPLAAIVLCQAAFAKELRSRTVLFLEALPVSRLHVVLAKIAVSLGALLVLAVVAFELVVSLASKEDAIDGAFRAVMAARTLAWTLLVWGVAFLGAVLGRFRWPFYLSLALAASLAAYAGLDPATSGPFALMSQTFEVQRTWSAELVEPLASGLGGFLAAVVLGLALLLGREGSVAVLLGERMTHREKVIVSAVLISGLMVTTVVMERRTKPPYALAGEGVVKAEDARAAVSIQPPSGGAGGAAGAVRLVGWLQRELSRAAEALEIERLQPIFLVHRADLDPGLYEGAELAQREGVLLRLRIATGDATRAGTSTAAPPQGAAGDEVPSDDDLALFTTVLREALDLHTERRTWVEGRMWVRDGFPELWAGRLSPARRDLLGLRALYAVEQGYGFDDLARWHTVRDRLSEPLATALAWSVLDVLAEARGDEAVRQLAMRVAGRAGPRGVLALRGAWSRPATELLPEVAGIEAAELAERWRSHLAKERARRREELAELPHLDVTFDVAAPSSLSRAVSWRLALDHAAPGTRVALLSSELWGLDELLERSKLDRETTPAAAAATGQLARTWSPGTRLYLAASVWVPALGCEVLAGAVRRTLE